MNDWNTVNGVCCKPWLVLPAVYSDALSYGDQIAQFCSALNKVIQNNNNLPGYVQQMIQEYISGGAIGEVVQTVIAKFILNVKYPPEGLTPAVGDGSADDTEAIQGCIDYAFNNGGMSVYFPSGSYLTQPLTLRNKATLFGQDRYTTRLVMKGGATTAMFIGDVDELTLSGLGFDGNMDIQVNNVNLFTISVNSAIISNCLLTGGYELLNITVNNDLQLNNLLFCHAVENALVLNGAGIVQGENLIFKSVSTLVGKNFVVMGVSKSILEQVKCYGASPNGVLITGDNNVVKMWNEQSLTPYVDNGTNNSITVYTQSEVEKLTGSKTAIIGGNVTETITGNKGVSAQNITFDCTDVEIDAKNDIFLNPLNPLKYGTLNVNITPWFKNLPMKDKENNPYNILVSSKENLISSQYVDVTLNGVIDSETVNQTSIIQKLIDTYPNLYFPKGTYLIDTLLLRGKHLIHGDDAIFIGSTQTMFSLFEFNGIIDGLIVKHDSIAPDIDTFHIVNSEKIKMQNILIEPCAYIGIGLNNVTNSSFSNIIINNYGTVGIYTENCENLTVVNCNINGNKGVSVSHCLQFNRGKNNTAFNNLLTNGGAFGISLVQESRSYISANKCFNSYAEGINLEGCNTCVIDGNFLWWDSETSNDFGICIFGPTNEKNSNFNKVCNNYIQNCGKAGIAIADICLFNSITGNIIYNGNLKKVTDVDGMLVQYQQQGTQGGSNNLFAYNLGSGDNFNYLYKQTAGANNLITSNYMLNKKPSVTNVVSNLLQNPQLTWNNYTPTLRCSEGSISDYEWVKSEYAFDGSLLRLNIILHVITNGTGAGSIFIGLPYTSAGVVGSNFSFTGYEPEKSGSALAMALGNNEVQVRKYDSSYPVTDGSRIMINGYYELDY